VTRFSVVLPTYNRSAAIRPTIDSVLRQELTDWELLVVSDASTDDTDAVVGSYGDPRVRLVRCDGHAGHPGPPRNTGLAAASGELVAYLDHDDRWEPGHLAELSQLLGRAPVAATGAVPVDASDRPVGRATTALDASWSPELQVLGPIFEPSRVGHHRGVAERVGGWTADAAGLEDWDLWLRLADAGERFATSTRATARLLVDATTRRRSLPVRYELTLARLQSVAHAEHALTLATRAPFRSRLRELHVACAQRWYADMDTLVLPDGAEDLAASIEAETPEDTLGPVVGARATEDGGAVVARPLPCTGPAHAARVEALTRARFGPKLAFLGRILSAVAAMPAAKLGTAR
jgi:glycosyltransferase involved in cell wall biosynthesis